MLFVGKLLVTCVALALVVAADEDVLMKKFSKIESQLRSLTQSRTQEEKRISDLQLQILSLQQQLNKSESELFDFKGTIEKSRRYSRSADLSRRHPRSYDPVEVAFTYKLGTKLTNVPIHTTIKFDTMIHHTASYYDPNTGVFTCPTSGLYLFSVFIAPNVEGIESMVSLKKDGTTFMSVIAEASFNGEDINSGNVVLLTVTKGEQLWVETFDNDNQSFWKGVTTFSGVLIQRT